MLIRALIPAFALIWLVIAPIAAREPAPQPALGGLGGVRALTNEDAAATPLVTGPGNCTVEPRTLDEIRRLIVQANRAEATPALTPSSLPMSALPSGTAADTQTVAEITATTEQFFACLNAGDLLRFLAVVTDSMVVTVDRELGIPLDDPSLATPHPAEPDDPVTLSAIEEVRILPDGRAGAVVIPGSLIRGPVFFFFVHQGDRWLVDGVVDVTQEQPATPGPCCALPTPASPTNWQLVRGDNYEGVIVPEVAGPDYFKAVDGAEPSGYWTPAPAQIVQLEIHLWRYLMPLPDGERPVPAEIWQNLATYHRQYAGFITDDGRRKIEVNFFCGAYTGPWRSEPVAVLDGGSCFFRITYDPATGTFSDLRVNGEA